MSVFLISLREFVEIFIIFQSFITLLSHKETLFYKRIYITGAIGFIIALILPTICYVFMNSFQIKVTEETFEKIEAPMMIISGGFIIMAVLVFHKLFHKKRGIFMKFISSLNPQRKLFGLFVPLVMLYLIVQEGFEIALFTSVTSVMNSFTTNIFGLGMGLVVAAIFVHLTSFCLSKQFRSRIVTISEWLLIFIGLYYMVYGVKELI